MISDLSFHQTVQLLRCNTFKKIYKPLAVYLKHERGKNGGMEEDNDLAQPQ